MTDFMQAAQEAVQFIEAQRLAGRAQWRRTDAPEARTDFSLYHGSCGVILLLLELHRAAGAAGALAEAVAAGEEVAAYLDRARPLSVSVSRGWPGYAFALNELAKAADRPDFADRARLCLERLHDQAVALGEGIGWIEPAPFADITGFSDLREIYDQSVGAAGAGLVMLYAHREGLHPQALDWAKATGRRLLVVAEPDPAGLRWKMMADMPFPFTAPNFAHGGAGVGYFLAELYRASGEARFLDAAVAAARYVLSRATPMGERGRLVCHTEEARNPLFYLGACHGPAGTGRLFLALHELTGEAHWLEAAAELTRG
ncbi:MAG: lanthionine synthetase LanC family protein, partial [Phenylobacterium sp.]